MGMKSKPELTVSQLASLGGKARAAKLTPARRRAIAKAAGKKGGWPKGRKRK